MATPFDKERHRKAFIYTAVICSVLLIAFIFISWTTLPPAPPIVQDLMEVNLGNDDEGFGEVQPLIKGERSPEQETTTTPPAAQPVAANEPVAEDKVTPDDNAPEDAAPVVKTVKKPTPTKVITPTPVNKPTAKPTTPAPVVTPVPKPKLPKLIYPGAGKGGGNNATTDNGYTMDGNKKGGTGDAGSPTGNKDTYGNKPAGGTAGPRVISGNRKVVYRSYNFTGELDKATINAVVKVSPAGVGTFVRMAQGSTSTSSAYASAIRGYLQSMKFDAADEESLVTVQFNFNVK
jgi:outer membrane biosynthesis protein TonB